MTKPLHLWIGLLVFLTLLGLCVHRADADTLTVTWTAPTERVDGTPLPASEIAGYRLMRTFNGVAQPEVDLPPSPASVSLDLAPGKHCFRMRTVDTDGLESDPSAEACRKAKPNPPGNLRAK